MEKCRNIFFSFHSLLLFMVHPAGMAVLLVDFAMAQNSTAVRVNVGVIVDYDRRIGKMGLSCIEMAISEFYASNAHYKTRLVLHARDSKSDVVGAASAALDLIKNVQVQAIIGSTTSTQTIFVADLGEKAQVPIISFSTTDPSLYNQRSSYFFQAAQNVASQAKAVSAIVKSFGWTRVLPIFSDIMYGEGVIPCLTDALLESGAHAPYVSVISSSSTDAQLVDELRKLMRMQTRVFVVHADVETGTRVFIKANEIGMMKEGYVWIITDEMTSFLTSLESSVIDSMQGVLGIKTYVPETQGLKEFRARRGKLYGKFELNNAFGLRSYDAATALAMAVEVAADNPNHPGLANVSDNLTVRLKALGVSVSHNGPKLLQALSGLKPTKGLSGEFTLASSSRRSNSSTYQIINVHGSGEKVVGFWTMQNGLARHLDSSTTSSEENLGLIIWPGESTSAPKGWEISTINTAGRLRIGVPVKFGLKEFVKVEYDPITNITNVTGYCIDIFHALVKQLPYDLDYEFIPYGPFMGLYDSLVYQVQLGRFDVAVGDITITANRSLYVDFTLPFTEAGVSVIMPVKLRSNTNTWIFLKPWTWDLWLLIASFFIFNALVVWALEYQINEDFQGPLSYQIGTSLWFSFSTMAYAHQEKVVNNLARLVVVIWIFVVLILTQCYAASLTSFLTIQQLRPPNTDSVLSELVKSGESVAYQSGIVYAPLKELGFSDSQLRRYLKLEDAREMMLKGEVAAIIDEVPYNKLFLAKYCSNYGYYDVVDKRLKAEGFAFVFQRGSPLSPDFSKALMKTIRGSEFLAPIENKWFGRKTDCKDPNEEAISSSRLGPKSFRGLFLISGFSSLSALAIHAVTIFRGRRRRIVTSSAPAEASMWENFLFGSKAFHRKHSSTELSRRVHSNGSTLHGVVPIEAIENASNRSVTSSYSNHVDMINFNEIGNSIENQGPSIVELTIENNRESTQD